MAEAKHAADDDSEEEDVRAPLQFKIILLGDGAVGKTSIAHRFVEEQFSEQYKQTLGVDFFSKRMVLPGDVGVVLQIWDIGGQSIGSKMLPNYIHGSHAVMFCYDITNYDSFANLEDWYRKVHNTYNNGKDGTPMPCLALVGNKIDLSHMRAVRHDHHNLFADENTMYSYMLSAKNGDQVNECFFRVAAHLAGVKISKLDLQEQTKVLPAAIVNHQQHDDKVNGGQVPDYTRRRGCVVM